MIFRHYYWHMTNLIPEIRINKNGVPVTKYVRPSSVVSEKSGFPSLGANPPENLTIVSDALKSRLERDESFRKYSLRDKFLIGARVADFPTSTVDHLASLLVGQTSYWEAELVIIEMLHLNRSVEQIDDVLHVLSSFDVGERYDDWRDRWRESATFSEHLVTAFEGVLSYADDCNIPSLSYRYWESDRTPLRLLDKNEYEKVHPVLDVLVDSLSPDSSLESLLNTYSPPSEKQASLQATVFDRLIRNQGIAGSNVSLFKLLHSEDYLKAAAYLSDERGEGNLAAIIIAANEYSWFPDIDELVRMSDEFLADENMSDETFGKKHDKAQEDLYYGRMTALIEAYPDRVDDLIYYINDRGLVVPDKDSESLVAYLNVEEYALRSGIL